MEPNKFLLEELELSKWLIMRDGLKAQWKLCCEVKYWCKSITLLDFGALWG